MQILHTPNSVRVHTVEDLATAAQIHVESVRRAIRQGRLKALLFGRHYRIPGDEFDRVISEGLPPTK